MSSAFLILACVAVLVAVAAFVVGRMTSPEKTRAALIQKELELNQKELDRVRGEVNDHFEQSTKLFGRLAQDYRDLYDHYSDSALKLGFLENEDASLLELSDPHFVLGARSEAEGELEGERAAEVESEVESEPEAESTLDEGPAAQDETPRSREAQA